MRIKWGTKGRILGTSLEERHALKAINIVFGVSPFKGGLSHLQAPPPGLLPATEESKRSFSIYSSLPSAWILARGPSSAVALALHLSCPIPCLLPLSQFMVRRSHRNPNGSSDPSLRIGRNANCLLRVAKQPPLSLPDRIPFLLTVIGGEKRGGEGIWNVRRSYKKGVCALAAFISFC